MSALKKSDKREPVRIQLRKNDQVKVIAGRDKGKTGRVIGVDPEKGRILVMDDEADILTLVREMLQMMGYEVETARDGVEALQRSMPILRPPCVLA